jgi:hypothetical protein
MTFDDYRFKRAAQIPESGRPSRPYDSTRSGKSDDSTPDTHIGPGKRMWIRMVQGRLRVVEEDRDLGEKL